jgi:hypothetical protein
MLEGHRGGTMNPTPKRWFLLCVVGCGLMIFGEILKFSIIFIVPTILISSATVYWFWFLFIRKKVTTA